MDLSKKAIKDIITKQFPVLGKEEIKLFLSISEYSWAKSKKLLLKGGSNSKQVLLILKGSARAFMIDKSGQDLNNYLRTEGNLIADARVFGNETQILSVESVSEIHYLKFDIEQLEQLGYKNKKLMEFYLNFLKEIILALSHRVNTFVSMTAKERYDDLKKWNPLYLHSTYDKHIASFLGITPLTLHRIKKNKIKPIK
ncbi:Crp/Fnr family transcriptional regulator [Lutibacter holmesii]|uniref:Crp/Fnr family transcriptional regulator n=1 Tax=Lutibacter holmesii TaxID=1137985 RepID=A0ABW3WL44_9FLAO